MKQTNKTKSRNKPGRFGLVELQHAYSPYKVREVFAQT